MVLLRWCASGTEAPLKYKVKTLVDQILFKFDLLMKTFFRHGDFDHYVTFMSCQLWFLAHFDWRLLTFLAARLKRKSYNGILKHRTSADGVSGHESTLPTRQPCSLYFGPRNQCYSEYFDASRPVEKVSSAPKNSQEFHYVNAEPGSVWSCSGDLFDSIRSCRTVIGQMAFRSNWL